jgi:CheY-like chemotaxis protein
LSQLLAAGPSDPPSERQATQFEAIQHAGWHLPALILLDMYLSGLQVLDALRADPATRALRVVALSASAMSEEVASARKRGVLEYWTKPLGMDRCLADVQRLLAPVPA